MNDKQSKPVIALIADGASDPAGQRTLENIDGLICGRFPDHEIRWGFQATYMIEAFKKRGVTTVFERKVPLVTAADLLTTLAGQGTKKVAMQLLMVAESSFSAIALAADTHGMTVKYGLPFLGVKENILAVPGGFASDFGDGDETATMLTAHGALRNFQYNDCFIEIDNLVRKSYKNVFLGTLHGPPGIDGVIEDVKKSGCQKLRFISLMLVARAHYQEIMGDGPESWKSRCGLPAEHIDKFATFPVVTDYFTNSIDNLISQL